MSRRLWWVAGLLASSLALGAWLGPQALSFYHQGWGAQKLVQALAVDGREISGRKLTQFAAPLADGDARVLAEEAVDHFRAAAAADRRNGQVSGWLGRAFLLLDRPEVAVEALSSQGLQRPVSPSEYWELGLACERMARWLEGATLWTPAATIVAPDQSPPAASRDIIPNSSGLEAIPCLPRENLCWHRAKLDGICFATSTVWEMPSASTNQSDNWLPPHVACRPVLPVSTPSQVTFRVTLPLTPTALTFWMGGGKEMSDSMSDGVLYRVLVEEAEVFTHWLTAEETRAGWHPGSVDLRPWAGKDVRLVLATEPYSGRSGEDDRAGWGDVRLVAYPQAAYIFFDPDTCAMSAWNAGRFTAEDFIAAGEEARRVREYGEAVRWYRLALRKEAGSRQAWHYLGLAYRQMDEEWMGFWHYVNMDPKIASGLTKALDIFERASLLFAESRDTWYELGRTHMMRGDWQAAIDSFQRGAEADIGPTVGVSDLHLEIGRIRQHALDPKDLEGALSAYRLALSVDDYSVPDRKQADTYHQLGILLAWQGLLKEAVTEYETALRIYPEHYAVHMSMAQVLWGLGEEDRAKETTILAMTLAPDQKGAYLLLGRFYADEGRWSEARTMYHKVLELDPQDTEANRALEHEIPSP